MTDEHLISLQPGTVISGRYEVVKCLGAGSMGLVYACRHRELAGHLVAVKVLFPEVAQDKIAAARFRNEIFASYGVSHPNVVRAYEYLRDGDLVAYTMEYVGGGDLADRLSRSDDPLSVPEIVRLLSQMCSGVQAIHDAGIIHRDLKPENILLSKEGQVKIADFGIARTGHGPKLTEHGGVVGTIDYVSPEYMLNSQVDTRSDIYALGILGYEMITGESPFKGDSVYATMTKRLKSDPAPPSSMRPECPAELDRIILHAMGRDPESRYQKAHDMFLDLNRLAFGAQEMPARTMAASPGPAPAASPGVGAVELGGGGLGAAEVGGTLPGSYGPSPDLAQTPAASPGMAWGNGHEEPSDFGVSRGGLGSTAAPETGFSGYRVEPGMASYEGEDDTVEDPPRMEAMLGDRGSRLADWSSNAERIEVNVSAGGIDPARMRNLSQLVDQVQRPIWADVVELVVTVLIGVGIGFGFVKLLLPEWLSRDPAVVEESVAVEDDEAYDLGGGIEVEMTEEF